MTIPFLSLDLHRKFAHTQGWHEGQGKDLEKESLLLLNRAIAKCFWLIQIYKDLDRIVVPNAIKIDQILHMRRYP